MRWALNSHDCLLYVSKTRYVLKKNKKDARVHSVTQSALTNIDGFALFPIFMFLFVIPRLSCLPTINAHVYTLVVSLRTFHRFLRGCYVPQVNHNDLVNNRRRDSIRHVSPHTIAFIPLMLYLLHQASSEWYEIRYYSGDNATRSFVLDVSINFIAIKVL